MATKERVTQIMCVYLSLTSGSHLCSFGSKKLQHNFRTLKVTRLQNEKWGGGEGGEFGDQVTASINLNAWNTDLDNHITAVLTSFAEDNNLYEVSR